GTYAATCCVDPVRTCAARDGGACLDLARGRARLTSVLIRSRPPVRRRSAPRHRPGRAYGLAGARARGGCRLVRGHRSDGRKDGLDRDAVRIHGDARPSRLDRRQAGRARRRGICRRRSRPERRLRPLRSVRLLRRSPDARSTGLRRPAEPVPAAVSAAAVSPSPVEPTVEQPSAGQPASVQSVAEAPASAEPVPAESPAAAAAPVTTPVEESDVSDAAPTTDPLIAAPEV